MMRLVLGLFLFFLGTSVIYTLFQFMEWYVKHTTGDFTMGLIIIAAFLCTIVGIILICGSVCK